MKKSRLFCRFIAFLIMKRIFSIMLVLAIMVGSFIGFAPAKESEAAAKTITVKAFNKLFKKSIKNKDARALLPKNSSKAITRIEAARILSQAYEILNPAAIAGDDDVDFVVKYRIRDFITQFNHRGDNPDYLTGISETDQKWFAKAYIYGLITAKDWQTGAHSYTFKATAKMTKSDAKASIKALKSAKKRYKLSDDWQMIRTTNLPEQAKYFPYILTTFPNEYYDEALAFDARYTIAKNKGAEKTEVEAAKKLGVTPVSRVDTYWNLMTNNKECSDILKKIKGFTLTEKYSTKEKYDRLYKEFGDTYDIYFEDGLIPLKKRISYIKQGYLPRTISVDSLEMCICVRKGEIDGFMIGPEYDDSVLDYSAEYIAQRRMEEKLASYLTPAEFYKVKDDEFFKAMMNEVIETGQTNFVTVMAGKYFNNWKNIDSNYNITEYVDTSTLYICNGRLGIRATEINESGQLIVDGPFTVRNIISEENGKIKKTDINAFYEKTYKKQLSGLNGLMEQFILWNVNASYNVFYNNQGSYSMKQAEESFVAMCRECLSYLEDDDPDNDYRAGDIMRFCSWPRE